MGFGSLVWGTGWFEPVRGAFIGVYVLEGDGRRKTLHFWGWVGTLRAVLLWAFRNEGCRSCWKSWRITCIELRMNWLRRGDIKKFGDRHRYIAIFTCVNRRRMRVDVEPYAAVYQAGTIP